MGSIVIRRGEAWYGSGLPLFIFVDNVLRGSIPSPGGIALLTLDDVPKVALTALLDGCRSRPLVVSPSPQVFRVIYRPPPYPLLYALFERSAFGSFERDQ